MARAFIHRGGVQLALRLLAAVFGGYAFTAAWVAAAGGLLAHSGLQRSDGVALAAMLGFVFYLVFLVWAFSQPRLARLWSVTVAGTATCLALVHLMNLGS